MLDQTPKSKLELSNRRERQEEENVDLGINFISLFGLVDLRIDRPSINRFL